MNGQRPLTFGPAAEATVAFIALRRISVTIAKQMP